MVALKQPQQNISPSPAYHIYPAGLALTSSRSLSDPLVQLLLSGIRFSALLGLGHKYNGGSGLCGGVSVGSHRSKAITGHSIPAPSLTA